MKKIIILIFIVITFGMANTINILNWTPDYKYTSTESYPFELAKNYCSDKSDCHIKRMDNGLFTINKNIKNCPALKTGNMDEYIADAFHMHEVIRECFASDKKIHFEGHVVSFKYKNTRYYVNVFEKYDNKYGKIYKIRKNITKETINFKEN